MNSLCNADVFAAVSSLSPDALRLAVKRGASVLEADGEGYTPLHRCAELGRRSHLMDLLFDFGADVHSLGGAQLQVSATYIAAFHNDVATIAFLAARGGDVGQRNGDGTTPVHAAARHRNLKALEALRAIGAELNVAAEDGETPLFVAARHDNDAAIRYLHGNNCNVNGTRSDGSTPIFVAAQDICPEVGEISFPRVCVS